jgi:hypothetical protein
MIVAYTLSMPSNRAWDGKWSGEDRSYVVTRAYRGKKGEKKATKIVDDGPYHYNWDDGWGARIDVKIVDAREAASLRSKSAGFCGYKWMIDTIEEFGKPLATHEISARQNQCELT